MVKSVTKLAKHPHLGVEGRQLAAQLFMAPLWDATCRYFESIGDPYQRRDDDALHRVRIASKKCRYNFEVAALFLGEPANSVAKSLETIQDILGRVHDRSVAIGFLDTLHLREDDDIDVRRVFRAEITELRPLWIENFEAARRRMLELFAPA
jgi:CHAD domain-containing protein